MKWHRHGDDVIPAWIAEADATLCPVVRDAVEALLGRGELAYPPDGTDRDLAEAWCARQAEWFGWAPDPDGVRLGVETIGVMSRIVDQVTEPGEPVAMHTPGHHPILDELATL